jgi:hypothetical protein
MADNRGGMAILPLYGRRAARNPCLMAVLLFLVLVVALVVASAAGWVTDSRTFTDWPSTRDGDRQPAPRL